jgi:hypothetical protein
MQMILAAFLGALYVFAGYRTVRFTSRVSSALVFLCIGLWAAQHVENGWIGAGIAVAAAVSGYLLGNAYYYVHVVGAGALGGVILMAVGAAAIGGHLTWGSGLASAALGSLLACRFQRPIVIFATSLIGAILVMMVAQLPLAFLLPGPKALAWTDVAVAAVVTTVGCVVQSRTTRRLPAQGCRNVQNRQAC